mgnify:CR=1 FL=1
MTYIKIGLAIIVTFFGGWYFGQHSNDITIKNVITTEISVITEIENCKKWQGVFTSSSELWSPKVFAMNCRKTYTEGNKEITETLFEYFIKLEKSK